MLVHLSLLVLFPVTNPCYIRESKKGKKKTKQKRRKKAQEAKLCMKWKVSSSPW